MFYEDTMLKSDVKRSPDSSSAINFLQMLHHIAEAQHFEVQFYDITELSVSGQRERVAIWRFMTLLHLAVMFSSHQALQWSHTTACHQEYAR